MSFNIAVTITFFKMKRSQILVGIIMDQTDWPIMRHASETLKSLSTNLMKRK